PLGRGEQRQRRPPQQEGRRQPAQAKQPGLGAARQRPHTEISSVRSKLSLKPKALRPPTASTAVRTKRSSTRSRAVSVGSSASRKPRSPSIRVCLRRRTSSSV